MRVIAVNRFFHPDISATSQILSDVLFALARAGHEVHIITSRLKHGGGHAYPPFEMVGGVTIHRVWTSSRGRHGLKGRALDYATFHAAAALRLARIVKAGDIVILKTDPPLIAATLTPLALLNGAVVVSWVQDLFPEVATAARIVPAGRLERLLVSIRDRSLKSADRVVAIGDRMATTLSARGVEAARLATIPNFVDDERIVPVPPEANPLRAEWDLAGKVVVGYSGTLGRAHDGTTILAAAERLRDRPDIAFLMVGGGVEMDHLKAEVASRRLCNIQFRPLQSRDRLGLTLSVPDIHWMSLRPEQEGLIVPSKLYGAAAAGRPILMIGSPDGEIGTLLKRSAAGVTVREGDGDSLATAIRILADEPSLRAAIGARARKLVEECYSRRASFAAWNELVEALGRQPARTAKRKGSFAACKPFRPEPALAA